MKYLTPALAFLTLLLLPASVFAAETVNTQFVSLTNIPRVFDAGTVLNTPEGLSAFLNNIYRASIGIAAVIAVLQIMRAGVMYMGGDSVTEKKEAKNLIGLAIGGLILVLSPVIVFSIINPRILDLKIEGINDLDVDYRAVTGGGGGGTNPPVVTPPELRGEFYSKESTQLVAMAQLLKTTCNDAIRSSDVMDIVKNRRPRGPETEILDNATRDTVYSLYCESMSHPFIRYELGAYDPEHLGDNTHIVAKTEVAYAPGEGEKQARYESGCAADGGKLVRDPDWYWSGFGGCSEEIEKKVLDAAGKTKETHAVNCQQVEYRCVKP